MNVSSGACLVGSILGVVSLAPHLVLAQSTTNTDASGPSTAVPPRAVTDFGGFVEEVEVEGRAGEWVGLVESSSRGSVGAVDLERRPILRTGELLEAVPGVVITQHSGGGKANQYFLRGFNLDHGTDFAVSVDGMPVNMPSHGHGQGYADLNFLIPELVAFERYAKGPYDPRRGDFSAAGAVDVELKDDLPAGLLAFAPGEYGARRAVIADAFDVSGGRLVVGGEWATSDGPWARPDAFRRLNGLVRYVHARDGRTASLTAMAYDGRWDATDQIPRRAVDSGALDRFDGLDDTVGGDSSRFSLSGALRTTGKNRINEFSAYLIDYRLALFSNFTYFLDDPIRGDQFRQLDDRFVSGLSATQTRFVKLGKLDWELSGGLSLRRDEIDNGLAKTSRRRLVSVTRADEIEQWGGGLWGEARTHVTSWLRGSAGLRLDGYHADVGSDRPVNSDTASDHLVSPKLNLVFGPWHETEITLNAGYGFHSNDARGATIRIDPATGDRALRVAPLVRARGLDVGVRTQALPGLQTTLTAFLLDVDSELVFVGDAGSTEASRPSRRVGIEWTNYWKISPRVGLDLDLSLSHGRFADDDPAGDRIPGSIERALAAGLTLHDFGRWSGGLRVRHFGPRPLIEDDSVRSQSSTLVYADLGYTLGAKARGVHLGLSVFNLLNAEESDIDYFYSSQLRGEAGPVDDLHFHPAEPRQVRLSVGFSY